MSQGSTAPLPVPARAVVVGGGPAGLIAAEVLARAGLTVTVHEHMPSVGRKLLLAGRSGLNLTHSEPLGPFIDRYQPGARRLAAAVRAFAPADLRAWSAGLGHDTFVGSTGRVFPTAWKATPLLRAWLARLDALGVTIETRSRWLGWCTATPGAMCFTDASGRSHEVMADVTVLALGGASWPRVGSDGGWVAAVRAAGIEVTPLRPSNCGLLVAWRPEFVERFAGTPLKNVAVSHRAPGGSPAATVRGDVMVTATGLEGGPVYSVSAAVAQAIDSHGCTTVTIDLHPDLDEAALAERWERRRPGDSTATALRRSLGMAPVGVALLREAVGRAVPHDAVALARLVKAVPVPVRSVASIDRAISSGGGIALDEIDGSFMLLRRPGVFVAGEMLDWDAPTGGYLLQGAFSTGVAAARGAIRWLGDQGVAPTA